MTASQLIRQHWDSQPSLPRHGGAESRAVAAFEARHSVVLPADFREYLIELNGLPESRTGEEWDSVDSSGFEFLPLALLRRTERSEHFFVFARWALGDSSYAICLGPSRHHGRVVAVGDSLHSIADSFTEFANMYVADSMSLYGGGPVVDVSETPLTMTGALRQLIERFSSGEDASVDAAKTIEVALDDAFCYDEQAQDVILSLACYRPGGGEFLYNEDEIRKQLTSLLPLLGSKGMDVDRFAPLVNVLRGALKGSADHLVHLGRKAQFVIATASGEAPALSVRSVYSKLYDVVKGSRPQPCATGVRLPDDNLAFIHALSSALEQEIATEIRMRGQANRHSA